jgi:hypothetical protein
VVRLPGLGVHRALTGSSQYSYGVLGAASDPRRPKALGIAHLALPRPQSEHLHDPAEQAATAQPLQPQSAAIPTRHHDQKSTHPLGQTQVTLVTPAFTFVQGAWIPFMHCAGAHQSNGRKPFRDTVLSGVMEPRLRIGVHDATSAHQDERPLRKRRIDKQRHARECQPIVDVVEQQKRGERPQDIER